MKTTAYDSSPSLPAADQRGATVSRPRQPPGSAFVWIDSDPRTNEVRHAYEPTLQALDGTLKDLDPVSWFAFPTACLADAAPVDVIELDPQAVLDATCAERRALDAARHARRASVRERVEGVAATTAKPLHRAADYRGPRKGDRFSTVR